MNSIVLAVILMLTLSIFRINIVISLIISAIVGGLTSHLTFTETLKAFNQGLGNGAGITLSYGLLGAFALIISKSGLTAFISKQISSMIQINQKNTNIKYVLFLILTLISISSQNILPIHIAFIPIFIPPLLNTFNNLKIDRRLISCIITFGLLSYCFIPMGFGSIFLNEILMKNIANNIANNGIDVSNISVIKAMGLPMLGISLGLLFAIFITYKEPREYTIIEKINYIDTNQIINKKSLFVAIIAIVTSVTIQLLINDAMILGTLIGFIIFIISGELSIAKSDDIFTKGSVMLANIGFIMISAAGFASVVKATGEIGILVESSISFIGNSKPLGILSMLIIGLIVSIGIGSSFSTIPIISTIFVPLGIKLGLSPLSIVTIIGVSGALGDAGSPASDSTLGPTSGLNMDGLHNHIYDSVIPAFLHYNIPLIIFGFTAAMIL